MIKEIHKDENSDFYYKCDKCHQVFDEGIKIESYSCKDGLVVPSLFFCKNCLEK